MWALLHPWKYLVGLLGLPVVHRWQGGHISKAFLSGVQSQGKADISLQPPAPRAVRQGLWDPPVPGTAVVELRLAAGSSCIVIQLDEMCCSSPTSSWGEQRLHKGVLPSVSVQSPCEGENWIIALGQTHSQVSLCHSLCSHMQRGTAL